MDNSSDWSARIITPATALTGTNGSRASYMNGVPVTEPIPRTDRSVSDEKAPATPGASSNLRLVKQSFARVALDAPAAMEYFYARLFTLNPAIRSLFPTSMTAQRERMFAAFARLIWSLESEAECAETLQRLGRQHRRFGVLDKHYAAFFAALRDTVRHCAGTGWTDQTASAWQGVLDYFAATMRGAAAEAGDSLPWWVAEIVSHELRAPGVAVLRLRTDTPLPYQAGQYVPVQVTRWPRTWRPYSIATAPKPGGLLELHVRAVPGGLISNTLVHQSAVGDCVLLGAADGAMTLGDLDRDLVCVAGGTGLAPLKAIVEEAISPQRADPSRKITLFVGARQQFDLYDLEDLQLLEASCPRLRVIPVLSEQQSFAGLTGLLPDVISKHAWFADADVYVCGPAAMVQRAHAVLGESLPPGRVHHDEMV